MAHLTRPLGLYTLQRGVSGVCMRQCMLDWWAVTIVPDPAPERTPWLLPTGSAHACRPALKQPQLHGLVKPRLSGLPVVHPAEPRGEGASCRDRVKRADQRRMAGAGNIVACHASYPCWCCNCPRWLGACYQTASHTAST